jgi:type VI secretion system secreted protein Hcp
MANDAFIKIASIEGECTTKGFEKQIQLMNYTFGVSQHSGGSMSAAGGLSGGRADFDALTFQHTLDSASPALALACSSGQPLATATLSVCRSTGDGQSTKFMEYAMSDVIVTKVSHALTTDGPNPITTETVGLAFGQITWTYTVVGQDGKKKGDKKTGWNVSKNAKA